MIQIDMPMPKNCADCYFATADWVNGTITLSCMTQEGRRMYAPDLISRKDRPEWCPLKELEATTFKPHYIDEYGKHFICGVECGACHKEISSTYHYCPWCGRQVKWE